MSQGQIMSRHRQPDKKAAGFPPPLSVSIGDKAYFVAAWNIWST